MKGSHHVEHGNTPHDFADAIATSMALTFGPIVTVLEPAELRVPAREWANAIALQYESNLQVIEEGAGGKDV